LILDRILYENEFLAIVERDGYTFSREVRCKEIIVSVLPFRFENNDLEFLARPEICPAHGPELERCSITGGLKPELTIEETVLQGLWEEAGYRATLDELVSLKQVRSSKSSDTRVYPFAINVSHKQQTPPQGDGTVLEATASVEWIDYDQGLQIEDPLFITMMTRLLNFLEEKHDQTPGYQS
jgi:8-oxo-dGTP pyrophosphatase MutT (NUDIX family)